MSKLGCIFKECQVLIKFTLRRCISVIIIKCFHEYIKQKIPKINNRLGIDLINISNIFHNSTIQNLIPPYCDKIEPTHIPIPVEI